MDKNQVKKDNENKKGSEIDVDALKQVTGGSIKNVSKKGTVSKSKNTNSKL